MKLPNFEKFLGKLTDEQIQSIISDAMKKCEDSENFGTGGQVSAISWTISLELLALYHLWLDFYFLLRYNFSVIIGNRKDIQQ